MRTGLVMKKNTFIKEIHIAAPPRGIQSAAIEYNESAYAEQASSIDRVPAILYGSIGLRAILMYMY